MDVRIGITHTPKELEVEMPDDADRDKVVAEIEKLLKTGDGVLWLTDRKGRRSHPALTDVSGRAEADSTIR